MTETSIVLDVASVKTRPGRPATANIWMLIDGNAFPQHGWNDFVVPIITAWAVVLVRLLQNPGKQVRVHFMDGPYCVEVSIATAGILQVRGMQGPERSFTAATGQAAARPFMNSVIDQARALVTACADQGDQSKDVEDLKYALSELERAMPENSECL